MTENCARPKFLLPCTAGDFNYLPSLDGVRALAVMLVVISHFGLSWVPAGFGVTIFFGLSGFLITRLLLSEQRLTGSVDIPLFYMRRMLRLGPALLFFVAVSSFIAWMIGWPPTGIELAGALLYFQNYLNIHVLMHGDVGTMPYWPLWSLAVEEHFYLLFPFVFCLAAPRSKRLIIGVALLIVACLIWRGTLIMGTSLPSDYSDIATDARIDSIAFGVLLSLLLESPWRGRIIALANHTLAGLCALAVLLFCVVVRDAVFRETLRYTLQSGALFVLFAVLLFGNQAQAVRHWLASPALRWIGRLSYSLYLWNYPVIVTVDRLFPGDGIVAVLVGIPLLLIVVVTSYYLIEQPFNGLRARLHTGRLPAAGADRQPANVIGPSVRISQVGNPRSAAASTVRNGKIYDYV